MISLLSKTVPIWLKLHMSLWFLGLLTFNLLLDGGVMIGLLSAYKVRMEKDVRWRTVIMAWIFGVIGDFIVIMTLLILANGLSAYDLNHPFGSITGIVVLLIMVILSIVLVYFMIKYLLKRVAVFGGKENKIAIWMAIITAPYYILLPMSVSFKSLI